MACSELCQLRPPLATGNSLDWKRCATTTSTRSGCPAIMGCVPGVSGAFSTPCEDEAPQNPHASSTLIPCSSVTNPDPFHAGSGSLHLWRWLEVSQALGRTPRTRMFAWRCRCSWRVAKLCATRSGVVTVYTSSRSLDCLQRSMLPEGEEDVVDGASIVLPEVSGLTIVEQTNEGKHLAGTLRRASNSAHN